MHAGLQISYHSLTVRSLAFSGEAEGQYGFGVPRLNHRDVSISTELSIGKAGVCELYSLRFRTEV